MNRIKAVHDALETAIKAAFPGQEFIRNPNSYVKPRPQDGDGLVFYIALVDDKRPTVLDTLLGPVFDLEVSPQVIFAYLGESAVRSQKAYDAIEILKATIAADRFLGGACDYAELDAPDDLTATEPWLGGAVQVPVNILFTSSTKAG